MKSALFIILALTLCAFTSCERNRDKPTHERLAPKDQDHGKINEVLPQAPTNIASPATLNRIFNEAEEAFEIKDYSKAITHYEELLKILDKDSPPREMLYFRIGLGKLLGGKHPDAEIAFKECIQRFPKGDYTSRAYLGLARACMMQNLPEKNKEALAALNEAAADPKCKAEADVWISRISQSPSNR